MCVCVWWGGAGGCHSAGMGRPSASIPHPPLNGHCPYVVDNKFSLRHYIWCTTSRFSLFTPLSCPSTCVHVHLHMRMTNVYVLAYLMLPCESICQNTCMSEDVLAFRKFCSKQLSMCVFHLYTQCSYPCTCVSRHVMCHYRVYVSIENTSVNMTVFS